MDQSDLGLGESFPSYSLQASRCMLSFAVLWYPAPAWMKMADTGHFLRFPQRSAAPSTEGILSLPSGAGDLGRLATRGKPSMTSSFSMFFSHRLVSSAPCRLPESMLKYGSTSAVERLPSIRRPGLPFLDFPSPLDGLGQHVSLEMEICCLLLRPRCLLDKANQGVCMARLTAAVSLKLQ